MLKDRGYRDSAGVVMAGDLLGLGFAPGKSQPTGEHDRALGSGDTGVFVYRDVGYRGADV